MSEPDDIWIDEAPQHATENGHHDDMSDAFKVGLRRAGLHWMRAGYELLAGVGALLDEINTKGSSPAPPPDAPERIDLE